MAYFPSCITLVALGSGSLLCLCSQLFPLKAYTFFGDTSTDTRPKAASFILKCRSFKATPCNAWLLLAEEGWHVICAHNSNNFLFKDKEHLSN